MLIGDGKTIKFKSSADGENKNRKILCDVFGALSEKGYDPISQIVGYLLSEDPTYITNHNGARAAISKLDRDEAMAEMVRLYLGLD